MGPPTTIDLAKRKGVLRTRNLNKGRSSSAKSNNIAEKSKRKKDQCFSHFLVIDFEATCWQLKNSHASEIIEFPAVMLDAKTRTVLPNPFHKYVQPTEEPRLSAFCKQLTGISQDQVEQAAPLGPVLMQFKAWIQKHHPDLVFNRPGAKNCAIVTWTNWDLSLCLDNECLRKNLRKPECLEAWADLKHIYQKFYGRKPKGLHGALSELGLEFEGREHSGICDATNTARLVGKMIDDNCVLGLTKSTANFSIPSSLAFTSDLNKTVSPASTSFQTPKNSLRKSGSGSNICDTASSRPVIRRTPPLCNCGKRSRSCLVSKVGPNQRREFFRCSMQGGPRKCNFFKWVDNSNGNNIGESPIFKKPSSNPFKRRSSGEIAGSDYDELPVLKTKIMLP